VEIVTVTLDPCLEHSVGGDNNFSITFDLASANVTKPGSSVNHTWTSSFKAEPAYYFSVCY